MYYFAGQKPEKQYDFDTPEGRKELSYWSKNSELQEWMRELYFKKKGDLAKIEEAQLIEGKMFDEKYEKIEKLMILGDYFTSQNLYMTAADLWQLNQDNKQRNGQLQVGGLMQKAMELIQHGFHIFYSGDGW